MAVKKKFIVKTQWIPRKINFPALNLNLRMQKIKTNLKVMSEINIYRLRVSLSLIAT